MCAHVYVHAREYIFLYIYMNQLPEYVQSHIGEILAGTVLLLIIYGAIVSDGANFGDDNAHRIDPYKALGLPRSAVTICV